MVVFCDHRTHYKLLNSTSGVTVFIRLKILLGVRTTALADAGIHFVSIFFWKPALYSRLRVTHTPLAPSFLAYPSRTHLLLPGWSEFSCEKKFELRSRPDILLYLKYRREKSGVDRVDVTDSNDRILAGGGRFEEVPRSLPIVFDVFENEYTLRESGQQQMTTRNQANIIILLKEAGHPLTREVFSRELDGDVSHATLSWHLKTLEETNEITTTGAGAPKNPFCYKITAEPF